MNKMLAMLCAFVILSSSAYAVTASGNVNLLCEVAIEDLNRSSDVNTTSGCLDSDDVQLGVTTLFTIFPIEVGGLLGLIVLVAVLVLVAGFLGIKAKKRELPKIVPT